MALSPKFAGQRMIPVLSNLTPNLSTKPLHTLELYLDYVCPFSEKLFNTVYTDIIPWLARDERLSGRTQVIFRHQIQPWHPSSTLVHEAALAVLRLDSSKFWEFSQALFAESRSFYDISIVSETRNQTYARLAKIAARSGISENAMMDLLSIPETSGKDGQLNSGNGVTNDLKVMIKMARLSSIHVSPSVLWDGVLEGNVSSSWTAEQFKQWLESKIITEKS
ncbi:BgTH12-01651 [Blumeria graminis f. sp. triticale]|uniref:Thioredoxin-like fold domain-containing protein n=4 Tax=Blumeria graminis TaxID=34373 RepID=A0A656KK74_BLUGR|nr:hypothetical protein BGT96224_1472 [Blumeria graminis f. sp. tritici 96224]CAD6501399.1 BgTH12-01651 [Blumeria graminis f. sp. triticale]VDB83891.1 Bgt-1472 [Blumeria graminis f. sp. tritici]